MWVVGKNQHGLSLHECLFLWSWLLSNHKYPFNFGPHLYKLLNEVLLLNFSFAYIREAIVLTWIDGKVVSTSIKRLFLASSCCSTRKVLA